MNTTTPRITGSARTDRLRRPATAGAALLAAVAVTVGGAAVAAPASAAPNSPTTLSRTAPTGWLRVAHLAPGVPLVDIYLSSLDGSTKIQIKKAGYGSLTAYQSLKPGVYGVAMRLAGSSATSTPAVTWSVDVKAGAAYTVAAIGKPGQLANRLLTDDLTPPAAGKARIRLIQGAPSAQSVTVSAVQGPVLAQNVPYGATTGYADVPQGRWALKITAAGKTSATSVDVAAGGVYSLTVVQGSNGVLQLRTSSNDLATGTDGKAVSIKVVKDAAGPKAAVGGVNTGFGGMAPNAPGITDGVGASGIAGYGSAVLLGGVVVMGGGLVLRRRLTGRR